MIGTYRRYKKKDEDWSSNIYSNTGFIRKYILPELGEQIKKAGGPENIITSEHIQFGNLQFVYTDISSSAIFMDLHSINTENDNILVPANATSCKPYLTGELNPSVVEDYVIYVSSARNFAAVNYIVTENALILWNPYEPQKPALCMFILNYAGSQVTYASWGTNNAPTPEGNNAGSTASIAVNKLGNVTPIMSNSAGSGVVEAGSRMAINKGARDFRCKASGLSTYNLPHLNDNKHDLHLWTPLLFSFQELLIEGILSTKNMYNSNLLISDKTYHLGKGGSGSGYNMLPTYSPKLGTLNGRKCVVLDPAQFFPDYTDDKDSLFDFSIVYIYE